MPRLQSRGRGGNEGPGRAERGPAVVDPASSLRPGRQLTSIPCLITSPHSYTRPMDNCIVCVHILSCSLQLCKLCLVSVLPCFSMLSSTRGLSRPPPSAVDSFPLLFFLHLRFSVSSSSLAPFPRALCARSQ